MMMTRLLSVFAPLAVLALCAVTPDKAAAQCYDCELSNNKYYCDAYSGGMNYPCSSAPFRIYCSGCQPPDGESIPDGSLLVFHTVTFPDEAREGETLFMSECGHIIARVDPRPMPEIVARVEKPRPVPRITATSLELGITGY